VTPISRQLFTFATETKWMFLLSSFENEFLTAHFAQDAKDAKF